ncbi:MAG: hypothetical protein KAI21_01065, partial [Deltaproteobacteria bacterium]|nr:hypothetical protein [Deltaproteobacteria bacterium]
MVAQRSNSLSSDSVLLQPVEAIKGVGPRLARHLKAKGLVTVEHLLFNLPLGYLDQRGTIQISRLRPGDYVSFVATLLGGREVRYRRRKIYQVTFSDGTGVVTAKWFHYGRWLIQRFQGLKGSVRVSGTLRVFGGKLEIHHPEIEAVEGVNEEGSGGIVPRYSGIPGIGPRAYRRIMKEVVSSFIPQVEETLPVAVRDYFNLVDLQAALRQVHFPSELPEVERSLQLSPGLRRLIFEELFFLELLIIRSREMLARETGQAMGLDRDFLRRVGKLLPFSLTNAQKRVMREISADLGKRR